MEVLDFFKAAAKPPRAVIFMSGSGTNAEKLLDSIAGQHAPAWRPAAILTDNPASRAAKIAEAHSVPLLLHDIRQFYLSRGEKSISLASERGRAIRDEWTDEMRKILLPFDIDFGILAGFVPLTNICGDFPCLNVHPGDLTVEEDGRRLLVGLHCIPVETAILAGFDSLRSSVIVAQPYTGKGGEMDSGPILGISQAVPLDIMGAELADLHSTYRSRPRKKPPGGFKDKLEEIAKSNQERLKRLGDWTVFPPAVADFASGFFGRDALDNLHYRTNDGFIPVKTVEYHPDGRRIPIRSIR